jgi:succinate dehydrogenase / fumarate reductase cytochrome b subunit
MERTIVSDQRPKYLDLFRIRCRCRASCRSCTGSAASACFCSSRSALAAAIELGSPDSYVRYRAAFAHPLVKLVLIGLLWAFMHHLFAGLRFLALDLHIGTTSRRRAEQLGRARNLAGSDRHSGSMAMVKRIIVGAHYGLSDWLVQRVSAAYMAVYVLLFAWCC